MFLSSGDVEAQREFVEPLQQAAHKGLRFLLVSATLPQHIFVQLQELFPGLQPAFGPGLHRTAAGGSKCVVHARLCPVMSEHIQTWEQSPLIEHDIVQLSLQRKLSYLVSTSLRCMT